MSLVFPPAPVTGQVFPSPLVPGAPSWQWDGSKWVSGGFSGAVVSTSPLPPTNPRIGDLWFDPVQGNTYVWFDDGTSTQWVIAVNLMAAPNLVPEPPADGQSYIRRNGTWVPMTYFTTFLTSGVATPANVWTNILSIDVGTTGVWFFDGTMTQVSVSVNIFYARLWDGTTVIDSGASQVPVANGNATLSMSGFISNPSAPVWLQVNPTAAGTTAAVQGQSATSTRLNAMRIG